MRNGTLNNSERNRFERYVALSNEGRFNAALPGLRTLAKAHPKNAAIAGLIARNYYLANRPTDAARWFRKVIAQSPTSELASLGLFHSLLHMKREDEAFDEMRRFLTLKPSKEYQRLLRDINRPTKPRSARAARQSA
jgi:predicted Zn-dependent protease